MQENYLIRQALNAVWCSPRMDNQWVYAPVRISPKQGFLSYALLSGRNVSLPDSSRYYHVFQMGQDDPLFLNLLRQEPMWTGQKWIKVSDAMKASNMEVTIYNANGINLLRSDAYYMFTDDRCLFFIVPTNNKFKVDFEAEQIYFRFYTNPYVVANDTKEQLSIDVGYFKPTSTAEIQDIETKIAKLKERPGYVRCYANGVYFDNFNHGNIKQSAPR